MKSWYRSFIRIILILASDPRQGFSCEFCKIFWNTFVEKHIWKFLLMFQFACFKSSIFHHGYFPEHVFLEDVQKNCQIRKNISEILHPRNIIFLKFDVFLKKMSQMKSKTILIYFKNKLFLTLISFIFQSDLILSFSLFFYKLI